MIEYMYSKIGEIVEIGLQLLLKKKNDILKMKFRSSQGMVIVCTNFIDIYRSIIYLHVPITGRLSIS